MLVIDPQHRITVEEALNHPYVHLWYDASEVEGPPPSQYDSTVEQAEHTVDDWKGKTIATFVDLYFWNLALIYREIKEYETLHNIYGTNTPSIADDSGGVNMDS